MCREAAFCSRHAHVLRRHRPENDRKTEKQKDKKEKKKLKTGLPTGCAALGEAVLGVADFDGAPVAGSYQADQAQQVGQGPRHVGGVVTTGESPSSNLKAEQSNGFIYTVVTFFIPKYKQLKQDVLGNTDDRKLHLFLIIKKAEMIVRKC